MCPRRWLVTTSTAVAGSSRPKQAPSGRESRVPANRWPPRCVHSQTSSGSARARVATIGRPRTAQHASRVAWVQTSTIGSASSSLRDSGVAQGVRRVEEVLGGAPGAPDPGAAHRVDGVPRTRVLTGGPSAGAPHEQHLAAERGAGLLHRGTDGPEQRHGVHRLLGPRPLVLDEQPARGDGGRAGLGVTPGQGRHGAAREIGRGHPAMLCEVAPARCRARARRGPVEFTGQGQGLGGSDGRTAALRLVSTGARAALALL